MRTYTSKLGKWKIRVRRRLLLLVLLMIVVSISTAGSSIWVLYQAVINEQRELLVERVDNQAKIVQTIFQIQLDHDRKDNLHSRNDSNLDRLFTTYMTNTEFGSTGEFVLAQVRGKDLVFLLPHRFPVNHENVESPFVATISEPVRRALDGLTGTLTGQDYRGATVLAAYRALGIDNIGIVAKIDIAEIRAPFIATAQTGAFYGIAVIICGVVVFLLISNPLLANLDKSYTNLADAQRIAKLGSWERNLITNTNKRSDEVYRIYGVNPETFGDTYDDFLSLVHPDDYELVTQTHASAISGGGQYSMGFRIIRPNGLERYVQSHAKVLRDGDGNPAQMIGTVQDITYRKQYDEALKNGELRFRALVDGSSQGMLVHRNLELMLANKALADMFGYDSTSEITELASSLELLSPDEQVRVKEYYEQRMRGGDAPNNYDCKGRKKDGTEIWLNIRSYRIPWDGGWAICSNYFDITDARSLRNQAEQQARLQALGDLTTGAAHELNQPLNIVRMAAESSMELLHVTDKNGEIIRKKLERISEQTVRASAIIDRMRDFSNIAPKENVVFDLVELVHDTEDLMKNELHESGIPLVVVSGDGAGYIDGNRMQFEHILINMIKNAREAILSEPRPQNEVPEAHKITVKIDTSPTGSSVKLTISDTGPGIDKDMKSRIFDPFFTTREVGKGMGMGLAITYGVIRKNGGTIEVNNSSNGAVFTITLPCVNNKRTTAGK